MSQARRYCFTINNPTEDDCDSVHALSMHKNHRYLVVGTEKGEEGTPHLQCYVVFTKPMRFNAFKKLLPRAHIEIAKGSSESNYVYCTKDGEFEEYGECPTEGGLAKQVEDWDVARNLAKEGKFEEIPSRMYIKHKNAFHSIFDDACNATECLSELKHIWIYGRTGLGKSRYCWDQFPGAYRKPANKWWCHYTNQDVVIIEDVEPSQEKWLGYFLKIWSDHYPFIAERKGGSRSIRPKQIVVTSNYRIGEMFLEAKIGDPIKRRFTEKTIYEGELVEEVPMVTRFREIGRDHYECIE